MNILASYNWIKEYLDTDLSPEEFACRTTAIGNAIETTEKLADRFEYMVVGLVKKIEAHPDADKLHVVYVDVGKDMVKIVCGGRNLREDQRVFVGLPGAKVRWHGQDDLIEISKTKIRGVESKGMICAAEEVGFEKLSQGEGMIWDLTDVTDSKPGTPIAQALDLDDVMFDIEVTTNRVDCKSIIGQAREGVAIGGEGLRGLRGLGGKKGKITDSTFHIEVKEPRLCPKYTAIVLENVNVEPSPWWMQKRLLLAGLKPINNVVDVTNYVLHEYGQPLHAFDLDLLEGDAIVVRKAKKGEKFLALDGNTYELSNDQLVIADKKQVLAVAGVMGGAPTGTTEKTTRVLLECATFDPVSVRRTSRALNLYSQSQLLFEKGLSTQATGPALARAVELIQQLAGCTVASEVMVEQAEPYKPLVFDFDTKASNRLMGIDLEEKQMITILEHLGFEVQPFDSAHDRQRSGLRSGSNTHKITVPYWRDHDIENSVDFTEEIARVYGYDKIPAKLPQGELTLVSEDPGLVWERRIKHFLAGAGLTEVYSFAFVSEKQIALFDNSRALKLKNPLSTDQEYLRHSLVPSMLTSIETNQRQFPQADLFEIAPVYQAKKGDVPDQVNKLVIASYGKDGVELFFRAKGILERLLRETGLREWKYDIDSTRDHLHKSRQARLVVGNAEVGYIGQIDKELSDVFGLDVDVVTVGLDVDVLVHHFSISKSFTPIPTFPPVKRDFAFVVQERTTYQSIVDALHNASKLLDSIELFDVYRGKGVDDGMKSLALHLSFLSHEKTLEAKDVDRELEEIYTVIQKDFSGILRS